MVVAETRAQAMDAAEAVAIDYEELPFVLHSADAIKPGAATVWDEVPDNVLIDTTFGDKAATDRAFADADHVVKMEFNVGRVTAVTMELRAALGHFDAATQRYTLYAGGGGAVKHKQELADVLGVPRDQRARALLRRRRQFRRAQPALCRVRPGAVGVEEARPAGEIHRDALGGLPLRLPGPRPAHQASSWRCARTASSWRCAPTTSATSARCAFRCRR